jgi:hypothetical protein
VTGRLVAALLFAAVFAIAACDGLPWVGGVVGDEVRCGAFEGPDCNDLLEIGLDAVAAARSEEPLAIAVDNACPPNARCAASELGGATAAVIVRWPDGTVQWATIPLPPDWPASPAGEPTEMTDPVPAHLAALVGGG